MGNRKCGALEIPKIGEKATWTELKKLNHNKISLYSVTPFMIGKAIYFQN